MKRTHALVVAVLLVAQGACAAEDARNQTAQEEFDAEAAANVATDSAQAGAEPQGPSESPAVTDPDTGWTAGVSRKQGSRVATLREVRTASHPEYDRIVYEFSGGLPGYHIEYVDRPVRQCGSGDTVPLPGDAWLSMRFEPANAHTEEGQPTVLERQREWSDAKANLKALKLICDFEAQTEWVAGVGYPGRYRVLELTGPARIAIDVKKR